MGYRGKVVEQEKARDLRAIGWKLKRIAAELGVSRSSVSVWVRDVIPSVPIRREYLAGSHSRNRLHLAKVQQIEELNTAGIERLSGISRGEFLFTGVALYAGEGDKTDGCVGFANSDPQMIRLFLAWLRYFFVVDESRLRLRVYLHEGLDLDAANEFWSDLTGIPQAQFGAPYRAVPRAGIRNNKHEHGCPKVTYSCSRTHRAVMGLVRALLSSAVPNPGW